MVDVDPDERMTLVFVFTGGKQERVTVHPRASIMDVKNMVASAKGIPSDNLNLYHGGHLLRTTGTLESLFERGDQRSVFAALGKPSPLCEEAMYESNGIYGIAGGVTRYAPPFFPYKMPRARQPEGGL